MLNMLIFQGVVKLDHLPQGSGWKNIWVATFGELEGSDYPRTYVSGEYNHGDCRVVVVGPRTPMAHINVL